VKYKKLFTERNFKFQKYIYITHPEKYVYLHDNKY
jgi:hypothetical protein